MNSRSALANVDLNAGHKIPRTTFSCRPRIHTFLCNLFATPKYIFFWNKINSHYILLSPLFCNFWQNYFWWKIIKINKRYQANFIKQTLFDQKEADLLFSDISNIQFIQNPSYENEGLINVTSAKCNLFWCMFSKLNFGVFQGSTCLQVHY